MQRNTSDHLPTERHDIRSECQRIRAHWTQSERERRAGLAAIRQFALWESISQGPRIVTTDRRPQAAFH
jgi:hypothetical protein